MAVLFVAWLVTLLHFIKSLDDFARERIFVNESIAHYNSRLFHFHMKSKDSKGKKEEMICANILFLRPHYLRLIKKELIEFVEENYDSWKTNAPSWMDQEKLLDIPDEFLTDDIIRKRDKAKQFWSGVGQGKTGKEGDEETSNSMRNLGKLTSIATVRGGALDDMLAQGGGRGGGAQEGGVSASGGTMLDELAEEEEEETEEGEEVLPGSVIQE
jgi:hypothetical protein